MTFEDAVENIDIGGPSMVRAAAKNYKYVTIVVDPSQYSDILERIKSDTLTEDFRLDLSRKAFLHTGLYDCAIADYMTKEVNGSKDTLPDIYSKAYVKVQDLRYGENPHQKAAFYKDPEVKGGIADAKQLHGKELSYNNIVDMEAAWALEVLETKKNIRLIEVPSLTHEELQLHKVSGGLLIQTPDNSTETRADCKVVTDRAPTEEEWKALEFAWVIVKHVKSNAIVLTNQDTTLGVGAGQMNRVGSADIAIAEAGEKAKGSVMSSDAFFPFGDTIEAAGKAGITAVIQPGGSIRDQESIDMANKYGIAMVFTGHRHFRHS